MVGVIVPWNFPMPILGWGMAPGARGRQHRRSLKPAELTPLTARPARRAGAGGRAAGGRVPGACPARARWSGSGWSSTRACARSCFTGSTEVGKQIMAGCADAGEAAHAGAGRQERQHRLRRRRPGEGRRRRAVRGLRQRRAGLLRPVARSWSSAASYDRFMELLEAGGARRARSATRRRGDTEMGPLISAAHREQVASYVGRRGVAFRGTRPDGPGLLVPADRAGRPIARTTAPGDEEIFGPVVTRAAVRRRGRRGPASPTTPRTGCPARSGPATWAARCGWRGRSRPATCRSTRTPRCATGRRSAASSSPGLGRELGPDALGAFTETKNVFIADARSSEDQCSVCRTGSPSSPAAAAASGWPPRGASPRRAPRSWSPTSTTTPGRRPPRRSAALFVARRRHRRGRRRGAVLRRRVDGVRPVDIAFNNAGISPPDDDSILDTGLDAWRRVQEVNLTSVYLCCKYAIPHMQRAGARARSSTPPRSSRCWARPPRRSPTPPPRAACWR